MQATEVTNWPSEPIYLQRQVGPYNISVCNSLNHEQRYTWHIYCPGQSMPDVYSGSSTTKQGAKSDADAALRDLLQRLWKAV